MRERELIALFKLFLEMNDALEPYLRNIQQCRYINGKSPFDLYHLNSKYTHRGFGCCFLIRAFPWYGRAEGSRYWRDLNHKWDKVLQDVEDNQKSS